MSEMYLRREDLSNQMIYLLHHKPNPCHIRDKAHRYIYINRAMYELLNLPSLFSVEESGLSELKPNLSEFFACLNEQEEGVIQKETSVSLLVTAQFGRKNRLQPYIFDIHPFFDQEGHIVGTIAEARKCLFFSPLEYIQGKLPQTLKTTQSRSLVFTQRELEIIFYYYHRFSSKKVGEILNISHRTVENKLQCIYGKMEVHHYDGFKKYLKDKGLNQVIPNHLLTSSVKLIE